MDTIVGIMAFGTFGLVSTLAGFSYALLVRIIKLETTTADMKRELEEMKRKE